MWKTSFLSKIRAHKVAAIILVTITISSSLLLGYAFTGFLSPPGTCPLLHWRLSPTGNGPMPFQIVAFGDSSLTNNPYSGTGLMVWCIYTDSGALKESYRTDNLLLMPSASADGSYVVAPGVRIHPGRAGFWANGTIYLFNNAGGMLWKFSTPDGGPIFTASLNHNASVILVNDPSLYYLNHNGQPLWTGSSLGYSSIGPALS